MVKFIKSALSSCVKIIICFVTPKSMQYTLGFQNTIARDLKYIFCNAIHKFLYQRTPKCP